MPEHAAPEVAPGLVERLRDLAPVRLALYPVVVAVVALLAAYGVVTADRAPLWLGLAAAVLGTAGTEVARRGAYSPATVRGIAHEWSGHAADEYARGCRDALHASPDAAARCREVRGSNRCLLDLAHEGVHLIGTP